MSRPARNDACPDQLRQRPIDDAVCLAERYNLDRIVSNQPVYNMLNRYIERDIVPLCLREGIGQIVFSPLAQGILTGKYKPGQPPPTGSRAADPDAGKFMQSAMRDEVLQAVQTLQTLAQDSGCTLAQMALAWVLSRPGISSAIIGASRPDQVDENARAGEITLSADLLERIDQVLEGLVHYG